MPRLRILATEEIEVLNRNNGGTSDRARINAEYDELIAPMEIGNWAEVDLDVGENKPTVRNRIKGAATRKGMNVIFRRVKGNDQRVVFHLEEPSATPAPSTNGVKRQRKNKVEETESVL